MKTKKSSFTIKPFKNRNGTISFRVSGWLLSERIRRNFKTRENAILERGTCFKLPMPGRIHGGPHLSALQIPAQKI